MSEVQIHENQPVLTTGTALKDAQVAVILLHGRGSTAQSILSLATHLPQDRIAYLAPQAANHTWYPYSGFIPVENNEPYVSSAFQVIANLLAQIAEVGITPERVVIGGFSQGACLAAEFTARHPQRFGGLFLLSGALMGPPDAPRHYAGSLDGTPVFVAGSDHDSWVTEAQLRLTEQILRDLGGVTTIEVQPGTEHTVRPSEIARVQAMITEMVG